MGLIRNAVEQGRQAIESVRKLKPTSTPFDVVIIGAGPAGFSATLACKQHGLRYVTVEQESLGGRIAHFPRGKIVMTQPARLPIVGEIRLGEIGKDKLLSFMKEIESKTGIKIYYNEKMETIEKNERGFVVKTSRDSYATRAILLALGRGGTPRKLGVPGEELPKVVYRLIEPDQYVHQHILVVGGGDAALEAACSIAESSKSTVTLSYRSESFSRVKERNRQILKEAEASGKVKIVLNSNVREIRPREITIEVAGKLTELRNDTVIVCAGGILPLDFLKNLGIQVETKFGTR
jgi:thioredoxin reductase (NADPH)